MAKRKDQKVIDAMVKAISKKVVENLMNDECMMNEIAHSFSMNKKYANRPDLHDEYMEAWSIVEAAVRKTLKVKK